MLESTRETSSNPPPGLAGSSGSSLHQLTAFESFKRNVKRGPSQFSSFKEVKNWDTWRRNTIETARDHDVEMVLDLD